MPLSRVACLIAVGAALLVACTSSNRRDQYYGTDVGVDWVPPDATVRDTAPRGEAGAADVGEAGVDGGADAGAPSADAPASDTL